MAERLDPYKILQVDSEAEDEVIQAAYRRLARKYHPDLATTPGAEVRMAALNAAWELIGDPAARQTFDRTQRPLEHAPVAERDRAPTSASGPGATGGASSAADPAAPASRREPSRHSTPRSPGPSESTRPPETVSRDWTSGRSTQGGGFDESMRAAEGFGGAGPPPGRPSGTVLNFGRYAGWSLGEVARTDMEYIEWLDRAPIGRNYRQEIDEILRAGGRRTSAPADAADRRGLYRRR